MKILLITITYPPEIRAVSYMMRELAEELTARGHKVTVVTSRPQSNLKAEKEGWDLNTFSVENGVNVIRVKIPSYYKHGYIIRGLIQLSLPYLFSREIKRFVKERVEAVIVYTPPLPLGLLGARIKKDYNARYLLNVQDIFPENAVNLGIMKNRLIINFFERMESKVYRNTDRITSHTENSRRFLIEKKSVPEEKISTVYNWIDMDAFRNTKANGMFRERYGLKDKFIFLFPGILGPSQNLEFIIEVARRVRDIPDICFLFVGGGTEKLRLKRKTEEYGLKNVEFQPFVSKEEYPSLVKEMDVGLACLSAKNRTPVIPGKIFGFMASSVPIVAFLNKESDAHGIMKEAQCGYSMVSDDIENAAGLIKRVYSEKDKLAQYGENGYNYTTVHFAKKGCVDEIEQLLK